MGVSVPVCVHVGCGVCLCPCVNLSGRGVSVPMC